ncbi:uncharacterized protein Dmoj_GI26859 [Drosophila mojavensis]|uniref:Uncharacterized protein n=1 Tax=Drosophila mojavensis TaxID=7230 RepID=A0A0Q9X5C5_DROMO|nr:uncharacterized protein Dmoj_GI26859 [Drosophila mojavensis]
MRLKNIELLGVVLSVIAGGVTADVAGLVTHLAWLGRVRLRLRRKL